MGLIKIIAAAGFAVALSSCANMTGDQTVAEYCAEEGHANHDMCENYAHTEGVRTSLGDRIADLFGRTERAQATADEAMARQLTCSTHTLRNRQTGSCSEPGATLTSCVQTRYTTRAGGLSILRAINDTECRFNTRVLEMQVRCCTVGTESADATTVDQPAPAPQQSTPERVS
ncbi:MAG: hypothetical protein AB7T08_04650 [Hyphomonadaceae bacterium]